jgi:hypothetical protein
LQRIKTAIETDPALAELKIKVRQADWAKTITSANLLFPVGGAIIGAFIGTHKW